MRDAMPTDPPGTADFRRRMGLFSTGVCVVARDFDAGEGAPGIAAMTINSFVSVSLEPMLVCWSLHNSSSQYAAFAEADRFAVSVLAEGQADLARRYAARGDALMQHADFDRSAAALPVIAGSIAHFECRHWARHPAGDHTMILAEVTGLSPSRGDIEDIKPIVFFNGRFCSIGQ